MSDRYSIMLPFTREQFFDVFAAYNHTLWIGALTLWIASVMAAAFALARRQADRFICALLAIHWSWSAVAYHVAFFAAINPAAWLFAALFLIQAFLFFWSALRHNVKFGRKKGFESSVAGLLVTYALLYPVINAVQHLTLIRIPTFGVPCPTTIYTAGLLTLATPRSWRLSIVPIIWSGVGGSAAFLLGVGADYALPIAGIAVAVPLLRTTMKQSNQ